MVYIKEDLEKYILHDNLSYKHIGKIYGVSDTMIKKKAIEFGLKLPVRRKVNFFENFSHKGIRNNKVFKVSDEEFIKIINESETWKEIGTKLGYKSSLSEEIKKNIKYRCQKNGIESNIFYNKKKLVLNKTKGELFGDRKNWQSARSSIQKNARKVYFEYNKMPSCVICGYNKHVEVAHIKPVSNFGDNASIEEINSITNLIGLCPNHHWEYDNDILDINDALLKRKDIDNLSLKKESDSKFIDNNIFLFETEKKKLYDNILNYYINNEVSITETSKKFSCSIDIVKKILRENNITTRKIYRGTCNKPKKVFLYNKNNNLLMTFNSTSEAAKWLCEKGITKTNNSGIRGRISNCANKKTKSAFGYLWRYE